MNRHVPSFAMTFHVLTINANMKEPELQERFANRARRIGRQFVP
jgi:hypothetical protein